MKRIALALALALGWGEAALAQQTPAPARLAARESIGPRSGCSADRRIAAAAAPASGDRECRLRRTWPSALTNAAIFFTP